MSQSPERKAIQDKIDQAYWSRERCISNRWMNNWPGQCFHCQDQLNSMAYYREKLAALPKG
jgi:hypothetical protein